jgi:5-hydroxyisourate hydrolase-like protein (transthyretin family)
MRKKLVTHYFSVFVLFGLLASFYLYAEIWGRVRGYVFDEETKKPIKGVAVYLIRPDGDTTIKALTDDNGIFVFKNINMGLGKICFMPPAPYASPTTQSEFENLVVDHKKSYNIIRRMKYAGSLELQVIDAKTSKPIDGVEVTILEVALDYPSRESQSTDSQGWFRENKLPEGNITIFLRKDGYGIKTIPSVAIKKKEKTILTAIFNSDAEGKLAGHILCKDSHKALENIQISVHSKTDENNWSYTYTDSKGYYESDNWKPGLYKVTVTGYVEDKNGNDVNTFFSKEINIMAKMTTTVNLDVDCNLNYTKRGQI